MNDGKFAAMVAMLAVTFLAIVALMAVVVLTGAGGGAAVAG